MGWRVQQRVQLFPGVRLNLGRRGMSLTVGRPGLSVNLGPRGSHLNLGVPGTGISYRTRLSPGGQGKREPEAVPPRMRPRQASAPPMPLAESAPPQAIRSLPVDDLDSGGLAGLRTLILEAERLRGDLDREATELGRRLTRASVLRAAFALFMLRLLTFRAVAALDRRLAKLDAALADVEARRAGCTVEVDVALDAAAQERFQALRRAFIALSRAGRIWDVTARQDVDRVRERTIADTALDRQPVSFRLDRSPWLLTTGDALCLGNANGPDLYLYPGFVMLHGRGETLALLDLRTVSLDYAPSRFVERDVPPGDARRIGTTYDKANKDGSPDRRFRDNRELPVMAYGRVHVHSSSGLHEAYLISDQAAAERFVESYRAYRAELDRLGDEQPAELAASPLAAKPEPELVHKGDEPRGGLRWFPWPDLAAVTILALIVVGLWAARTGAAGAMLAHASGTAQAWASVLHLGGQAEPPAALVASEPAATRGSAPPATRISVAAAIAPLRAVPDDMAAILGTVHSGEQLTVFARQGAWLQVGRSEPAGWLRAKATLPAR